MTALSLPPKRIHRVLIRLSSQRKLFRIMSLPTVLPKRVLRENLPRIWTQPKKYAFTQNCRELSKFLLRWVTTRLTGQSLSMRVRSSIFSLLPRPKVQWKALNSDLLNRQKSLVQRSCSMKCPRAKSSITMLTVIRAC